MPNLKTRKLFEFENMMTRLGNITSAKLGFLLTRNAVRVAEVTHSVRMQLQGSDKVRLFRNKRDVLSRRIQNSQQSLEAIMAMAQELGVAAELEELELKEIELLDLEAEIEWIPIPKSCIPGLEDDNDSNTAGVLPLDALKLFYEIGLISENAKSTKENKK